VAADPNAADYHFNLAVSLKRHGDAAEALTELAQCLRLRPNDSEAQGLEPGMESVGRETGLLGPAEAPRGRTQGRSAGAHCAQL
jgi:hypothetical protein